MDLDSNYFKYWGKALKTKNKYNFHLLPYHCLDVAAVADNWLSMSPYILRTTARQINETEEKTRSILLFFILLHDLGKFDARFQTFVEDIRVQLQGDEFEVEPCRYDHGSFGYFHFSKMYYPSQVMRAVAGHHGHCESSVHDDVYYLEADDELDELDKNARQSWIQFCLDWCNLSDIPRIDHIPMLAGLCSVSDWIGSSFTQFKEQPSDLREYYESIQTLAVSALEEAGVINQIQGQGFEFLFKGYKPRGIQTLLPQVSLTGGMYILEADTGQGKTEAALDIASRLVAQGLADSIVFGLPTQATANGLFERLGTSAQLLFPDCEVTLAHSKRKYFLPDANGFLHQSNKRSFLSSMSVSTIDQILMGVLGVKHQFIRSFGTQKSVLILDEVHSYDSYMNALIEKVLQGQYNSFSSVILLSATLSSGQKNAYLNLYKGHSTATQYPLITHSDFEGNTFEYSVDEQPKRKSIAHQFWRTEDLLPRDEHISELIDLAAQDAVIAIICNTVQDAQKCYHDLSLKLEHEANLVELDIFHARYTVQDRITIEQNILLKYGKSAKRRGRILVATQVVEQSLDLDFDLIVSQIAPIELLFQRMGRLWRHERIGTALSKRASCVAQPMFITLVPESTLQPIKWEIHFGASGFVYQNRLKLHRTQKYLEKHATLFFPDCYRDAIEFVAAIDKSTEDPEELFQMNVEYAQRAEGSAYTAKMFSVLDTKPLNDVDPRCALLTREGEMTKTVVLFKDKNQMLHGGSYNEPSDREKNTIALSKKLAKGVKDEEYFCIKAIVGKDLSYSEIGMTSIIKQ